jgi:hypothetical protein
MLQAGLIERPAYGLGDSGGELNRFIAGTHLGTKKGRLTFTMVTV